MKSLSRLSQSLKQSDIRAVTAKVNAVNGFNLGQGICDLPTPQPIREGAQKAIDDNESIYAPLTGIEKLRERVLEKVQSFNRLPCKSTDEVLITVGSTGGFLTALFALMDPGEEVILFEPFYGYHRNMLALRDLTPRYVPLRGSSWQVDWDALEQAITEKTKAVVINTPANPCGKVWSREELEKMYEVLQRHDLYAITDEVYEYMTYDGREHISPGALDGAYERTITLSSFSKTFNMTGWRLGFAAGPAEIMEKMGLLSDLFYICAPTPLQHGLHEGFLMGQEYFDQLQRDYAEKRRMMCEVLEQAGFEVPWPQGSYYVFASFRSLSERLSGFEDDQQACYTLIDRTGVGSVPGRSFYEHPEDGKYQLRFSFAKEFDELERACERLIKLAEVTA